jgi:hypothetical protein
MPQNAISGDLEVLAMLPQLEFMYVLTYSQSVRAPVRHNLAAATVCSDLSDNRIGGTLEPLASLRRLSFLCALPSVTSCP